MDNLEANPNFHLIIESGKLKTGRAGQYRSYGGGGCPASLGGDGARIRLDPDQIYPLGTPLIYVLAHELGHYENDVNGRASPAWDNELLAQSFADEYAGRTAGRGPGVDISSYPPESGTVLQADWESARAGY